MTNRQKKGGYYFIIITAVHFKQYISVYVFLNPARKLGYQLITMDVEQQIQIIIVKGESE